MKKDKKIIYVRLVGGLGNQLYQYGYAKYLKNKYNFDYIYLEVGHMNKYKEVWGYQLDKIMKPEFQLNIKCIDKTYINTFRIARLISGFKSFFKFDFRNDKNWWRPVSDSVKNLYLDGYFECVDEEVENKVLEIVSKDLKNFYEFINNDKVIICVRGGRFRELGRSCLDDKEKYIIAINKIKIHKNECVEVVTDDVEYAKNLLKDVCDISKYHQQDIYSNFGLLYGARKKVIPNSTFAIWAAKLSKNFSKTVNING